MRKTLLAALAVLMIITLFGGCQLAVEGGQNGEEDVLCGVFITLEYLDTQMEDGDIELPLNWNGDPNDIVFPETRIYAKRHEDKNGFAEYTFDDIEGIRFFEVQTGYKEETGRYFATMADYVQDVVTHISDNDVFLTGTIYFDVNYPCEIYTNPVYQTRDGDVYAIQGNGMDYGALQTEGTGGSTTISETYSETVDGEQTSRTIEVEVKLQGVFSNKQVVIKQVDGDDQMIEKEVIVKDNIPESLKVLTDTEYLIMEEHCTDYEGKSVIKRTLVDMEEETLDVRFTGEYGIVQSYPVTLHRD